MLVENLTVNLWDCSVGGDRKEEKTLIAGMSCVCFSHSQEQVKSQERDFN